MRMDLGRMVYTVRVNDDVGFGDQINQFVLLHTLGQCLGRRFVYTPLSNRRSAADIFARIPLATLFAERIDAAEHAGRPVVTFGVADAAGEALAAPQAWLADLRRRADAAAGADSILELRLAGDRGPLWALVNRVAPEPADALRRRLHALVAGAAAADLFPADARIRVLVHIRQGDVATVPTPWDCDIVLWHQRAALAPPRRTHELRFIRALMRHLAAEYRDEGIAFAVFSDGYQRTRRLAAERLAGQGFFSDTQMALIDDLIVEQEAELALFAGLPRTRAFLGEETDHLVRLVAGITAADLVIANDAQRMTAKMIGAFGGERPRGLAVIGRDGRHDFYHREGIRTENGTAFIPIAWPDFSIEPLRRFIDAAVIRRTAPAASDTAGLPPPAARYNAAEWARCGMRLEAEGRLAEALLAFEQQAALTGGLGALEARSRLLAALGREEEAAALLEGERARRAAQADLAAALPRIDRSMGRREAREDAGAAVRETPAPAGGAAA
jgi:hypothetical protein